jgi:hypothetical protein
MLASKSSAVCDSVSACAVTVTTSEYPEGEIAPIPEVCLRPSSTLGAQAAASIATTRRPSGRTPSG